MNLSIRATTGTKIFVVIFCVVTMCCGSAPVLSLATMAVRDGEADLMAVAAGVSIVLLAFVGVLLWLAASVIRSGVRLDGTILVVQKAFTSSSVDLATAPAIWFDERQVRGDGRAVATLPLLCVRKPDGKLVQIALANTRRRLPPEELTALADAVEFGARAGTGPREAETISAQLRSWSYRLPG